ncbi:hypothetical protein MESS4_750324 [Mesorhizobium sp. STM 4661]|nr:hypothetical protein MESS4_750324 [Mesorhizobium sp. STM 4661]
MPDDPEVRELIAKHPDSPEN